MKQLLFGGAAVLTLCLAGSGAAAEDTRQPYVRLAELEIDPTQLDSFNVAIKEGIEAAVRLEPSVLVLYAVAEKDDPARIRVFEIYKDANAYQVHLQTPHFRKFRDTTDRMVKSRKLLDAIPIMLGAKALGKPTR